MSAPHCSKCLRPAAPGRSLARGLCDSCYFTHRSRNIAYGRWQTMYVDAQPTRDHIQAFRDLGIGFRRISVLTGVSKEVLRGIVVGRGGFPPTKHVHMRTESRVLAVQLPTVRDSYRMASPGARVDVTGTRRRLRALMRHGYPQVYLCSLISDTKYGHTLLWTDRTTHTAARIADRVAEIFEELEHVPGPSQRARNWAEKNGWPRPMDWDEETIDDPDATPFATGAAKPPTLLEQYEDLVDIGWDPTDLDAITDEINRLRDTLGIERCAYKSLYTAVRRHRAKQVAA